MACVPSKIIEVLVFVTSSKFIPQPWDEFHLTWHVLSILIHFYYFSFFLPFFYLWNTGLVTGVGTLPHPPKNHLEVFRQACFTKETAIKLPGDYSGIKHVANVAQLKTTVTQFL